MSARDVLIAREWANRHYPENPNDFARKTFQPPGDGCPITIAAGIKLWGLVDHAIGRQTLPFVQIDVSYAGHVLGELQDAGLISVIDPGAWPNRPCICRLLFDGGRP